MKSEESKDRTRTRYRKKREEETGIRYGCHRVVSAKQKAGDTRQGVCMVCRSPTKRCTCDNRSEWTKKRIG